MNSVARFILVTVAVVLAGVGTKASGEEIKLTPLAEAVRRINTSNPDLVEVAYVGTRSSALFAALAGYLIGNARDDKDSELAKKLLAKGETYDFVGRTLDSIVNGKSEPARKKQQEQLLNRYIDSIIESKRLNNKIISPLIEEDMKAADSMFEFFQGLELTLRQKIAEKPKGK